MPSIGEADLPILQADPGNPHRFALPKPNSKLLVAIADRRSGTAAADVLPRVLLLGGIELGD